LCHHSKAESHSENQQKIFQITSHSNVFLGLYKCKYTKEIWKEKV